MASVSSDFSGDEQSKPAPLVMRIRWVVIAAIAVSVALTLFCQPSSFWTDSKTAMRGDGLPIDATTNHTFDFFLGSGALPYLAANACYMALAFFLVSRLPRTIALIVSLSLIFAHGYGATHWLSTGFHLGVGPSPALWGVVFGVLLSYCVLPTSDDSRFVVNRWRWLVVATLFVDFANTLMGQPPAYWTDHAMMHEGNSLVRVFLGRGWPAYFALDLAIAAGEFALITVMPVPVAFVCAFAFTFGNFAGATNWFFYTWRLGWIVPVAYGAVLSTLMVMLGLRKR